MQFLSNTKPLFQPPLIRATSIGLVLLLAQTVCGWSADWPMRGRDRNRNPVVADQTGPVDWELPDGKKGGKNLLWSAELGTVSHGDPVVSDGLVWVGTNNAHPRDPLQKQDAGVLMCFDEEDGEFLYQYVSPRLPGGREIDWPMSSQTGSPLIENGMLWFCNNRHEVICLDITPLIARTGVPLLVWKVDLMAQFGVVPRAVMISSNATHCSIASYQNLIYVNTSNAAGYHKIPAPDAPSLICFQKYDGKVRWQDNSPGRGLLDVQHGSPLVARIQGRAQVIMGQGDGWLRGFDALTGEVLWKFDINFKSNRKSQPFLSSSRADTIIMPVFYENRVYFATGRHYEIGLEPGRLCCVDPSKKGDLSSELDDGSEKSIPNPNSGLIWQYQGMGDQNANKMHSTIASVAIHQGLVFIPDLEGTLHCVDAATGQGIWTHDLNANFVSAPIIIGNKVYVAAEPSIWIFELARQKQLVMEIDAPDSVETSPAFANDVLFLMTRSKLFAIGR